MNYQFHVRRVMNHGDIDWSSLNRDQPWFEWNTVAQTYTLRIGGVSAGILATYSDREPIRLFRGTIREEVFFLNRVKAMFEGAACDAPVLASLGRIVRPGTAIDQALRASTGLSPACSRVADRLIEALATDLRERSSSHGALFLSA